MEMGLFQTTEHRTTDTVILLAGFPGKRERLAYTKAHTDMFTAALLHHEGAATAQLPLSWPAHSTL